MLEEVGYEKIAGVVEETLQTRYRNEFLVTNELIYLNHAAVAPLCRRASEAIKHLADDVCRYGSLHYDRWIEAYQGLRQAAAKLINASPGEIALVKNTSEGIAVVAQGFDWRPGDRVVAFREEFPANYYPWARLQKRGVRLSWLSIYDPFDKIAEAISGARLLTVSFVNYLSGFRMDLKAIGEVCQQRGCFFFVDAIQGMGAFPIDVEACHIDGLAADGHKWMLGPEGNGVLYVRRRWMDSIEPVEFGYTNTARYADYGLRDMTLRPDAGRYECGTLNTAGCFGLRAALEFLLEVGVGNIAHEVQAITDQLAAGVRQKGYQLMLERTPETGSGIVSFRHPSVDCRSIVSELKRNRILAAPRQGWVRMSPHFYISQENVEKVLGVLPAV